MNHYPVLADGRLTLRSFSKCRLFLVACASLSIFGSHSLRAQMVTVNPPETNGALSNPLMGFRPDLNGWQNNPAYPTVVRHYIRWNEIENAEGDSVQKIRDYCNSKWASLPAANIKVIPRVFIDWDSNLGNEYWPSDLQSGDWSSQAFKDRVVRLIGRMGEVWDNDPRVAWVQTGIIGYWGEQENPVGVDEDAWGQRLDDAFSAAFQKKKLIVRNMSHWPSDRYGVYWDSYGHPSQQSVWNSIRNYNSQGRHLNEVVEGEVAYNWGETSFDPLYGGEPNITLNNAQYTDNMIDAIRDLHCTALGWISSYSFDGAHGTNPDTVRANAARVQREFGYRFHITEFSTTARTDPGGKLDVHFKVRNNGSAPFYEDWPVAVVLINESTRQIVWKGTLPDVDIRTWIPGSNYSTTTRSYQTPAQEHEVSARLPLPSTLATGQYLVGLTILEPLSRTPGLFFDVPNFFKQSQSQPLCRIGVGVNASSHTLNGVAFDNPVTDEARFYTLTQQGPSYSLTLQPSTLGTISKSSTNNSFLKDSGVEVKATGELGYAFNSWGGDLSGTTENPAIVVMDANKSISANYVPVTTYSLTTSASNGTIILNPPGGVYNAGTVVTLTASPNRGYVFGSWGGAASGSSTTTTITMTGDQNVTATFTAFNGDVAPWTETFTLPNGTKSDGPPTSWTATRSTGLFEVNGNRLMINQGSAEAILETSDISISGGSVKVSLDVQAAGGLDSGDYVRFYKIVDDGIPMQIGEQIIGNFTGTKTLVASNVVGRKVRLRIVSKVSFGDEFYYFDNLKVEDEVPTSSFTLTTNAVNGTITQDSMDGAYNPGSLVKVRASPANGYEFSGWSGDLSGVQNPTTILMESNKEITANFMPIPPGATGFRVNSGGPAFTDGNGNPFLADTNASGGGTYSTSSPIDGTTDDTLYQTERFGNFSYSIPLANGSYEINFMFAEIFHSNVGRRVFNVDVEGNQTISELDIFSKVGKNKAYNEYHIANVNDGFLNISFVSIPNKDNPKVSAIQVKRLATNETFTLQTHASNGIMNLVPSGGVYLKGSTVKVSVVPDYGYSFTSWGGSLTGSTNPTTILMDGDKSVVANFTQSASYSLTTNASNGSVSLDPPGGLYYDGTVVKMTPTPATGYKFFSWSGDHSGSVNPTFITINGNKHVTANFIVAPTYPYDFTYTGNPLVRNHGAADPDVHVWDGVVWMYCSQDHAPDPGGATYDRMDGYHAFSSTNMIDWVDHGEILHSRDVSWGSDGYMWAPGAAKANGQYYLYYPHQDKTGSWKIGVATSPVPQGPFTDIGAPMAGIGGIDPAVFIDDDGQAYIYNNNHIVAKLKPNMIELAEPTRSVNYGPTNVTSDTYLQFNEGSYMHKRNGIYYYSYSNFKNNEFQSFYATGSSPYGPFTWKGPMAPKHAGAQDHHSVIEFQNQWYYFYHVAVPNYPGLKDGQSRIACYDKLFYNPDGTMQLVNTSLEPMGSLERSLVNCGGPAYAGSDALSYAADGAYESGGTTATSSLPISGTVDDTLYQSYRYGASFGYNIPLKDGLYEATLMFSEVHHASNGSRVFNVSFDGNQIITGLDVHAMVGKNAAYMETHPVSVSGGQLHISFNATIDNAMISAIKLVPLKYTLQTNAAHGSIELDPPGGVYDPGQVVNLLATPDDGYEFSSWDAPLSGSPSETTIQVSGNMVLTANFTLIPEPWIVWQTQHFTQEELVDPSLSGENADFDSDGLVNLMEYAMGLLPKAADTSDLPTMTMTEHAMTLRYRKNLDASDVIMSAQFSENIHDWTSDGVTETIVGTNGRIRTIESTFPIPTDAKRCFGRVRAIK